MNNRYNEVQLQNLTYMIQQELEREGFNPARINYEEIFAHQIVCRLKYDLVKQSNIQRINKQFKQKIKHEIEVKTKYPISLWQMFKEKHLPKFLIKEFPVRYKTFITVIEKEIPVNFECEVGIDVVYPKITIPQDKYTANFRFMDAQNFTIPKTYIED